MRHMLITGILGIVVSTLVAVTPASAQGGGASQTGTINGKITDVSGAALPGVTVTIASSSMMGTKATTSNGEGAYRFPAVPPGTYSITYELTGFSTLAREGIVISLGFTATVDVELKLASLQETVTVTGESPVIDKTATRVQQNFKLDQLQQLPNGRDMWSLLAVTPAVTMSRIDVGGNRAGTQTGYTAYGFGSQARVLVEGINTTEGTNGAGFYFDYGSFEEVFVGTVAQGAEMPVPGVQSQFLGKSGGNRFQGEVYQDYERNSFQGANIPGDILGRGIREHSNEIQTYRDFNLNLGGPIKKDKIWWYFSYRDFKNDVAQPNFLYGGSFATKLRNPSGKVTYQLNQNNRVIGYYQWGQKIQPNRLPFSTYFYDSPSETFAQDSGSWVYKGEWNGTLSHSLYLEARYGVFGYYFPLIANSDGDYYFRDSGSSTLGGGDEKEQTDRQRRQFTGAATYFKDGWFGSHSFKVGAELYLETQWEGYLQDVDGHIAHLFSNNQPRQVVFDIPTATAVGKLGAGPDGDLLSVAKLDTTDIFLTDQWTMGRMNWNLGLRYDRYRSWVPKQSQLPFAIGPVVSAAQDFPEQTFFTWNAISPRIGWAYDIAGDGKTVLKANFGLYRYNPGASIAASANPNQASKTVTYAWRDANADRRYEPGEEGAIVADNRAGAIAIDPNITQPLQKQATAYVERQIVEGVGARVGFVYLNTKNLYGSYQAGRPPSAYTTPFSFNDIGPDGVSGTSDDQLLTFYGVPNALTDQFPTTQTVQNLPGYSSRYKTIEASLMKRQTRRFSANGGFAYTWSHDFPLGFPNTPNGPFDYDYTSYSLKVSGSYNGPWGIRLSPVYRFQSGSNFARRLSVSAPASCACTFSAGYTGSLSNTVVFTEPYDARRQNNVSVLDLRAEKTVKLPETTRLRLFLDLFNLTNAYAAETISVTTGSSFLRPTAILAPRTARVGFRFLW